MPSSIWLVDFEFHQPAGEVPRPICMVAREFPGGRTIREFLLDECPAACPIPLEPGVLYVAYLASAELSCHLALGWALPTSILDLFVEFRCITSGRPLPAGRGLLGALAYFELGGVSAAEKDEMRALAMRGGPYTEEERVALLDYCESDVVALARLLPMMWPHIDLPRALIRGRYMAAVARVERQGIPLDHEMLNHLKSKWEEIKNRLIIEIDRSFGVYDGSTFKSDRWLVWCCQNGIRWPLLESGAPDLKRTTFREMARIHPVIHPINELRTALSEMRLNDLTVGNDGRNRLMTNVFGSKTGRNTPSNSRSIFGPARWIRHLIKPGPGMALAYVDLSQQELGIAAALSGDEKLKESYRSCDPYLAFAKMAGAVPPNATKETHPRERGQYKVASLGVLMGMGATTLGIQTETTHAMGSRLLRQHQELFPRFWQWSDAQVDKAMMGETLETVYGWRLRSGNDRPTTYRNFQLQANGAEMLRLAVIAITERGISLCAMVHDAVLIEAPIDEIEQAVAETRSCMGEASRAVLGGFELDTDAEIIRWPERFTDGRGKVMWARATNLINQP